MDIKPSSALLTALASLQQGGVGTRTAPGGSAQAQAVATQTASAVPATNGSGVDIRVGAPPVTGPQTREAPGTTRRPLQPGLGRYIDLTV
ncbi:hypothetical protein [Zavarzinia sp.]|uniref:hypothetical protein n=1 Tax=Zavarzinia sp. TaxID=2027920 RepID=UPI003569A97D